MKTPFKLFILIFTIGTFSCSKTECLPPASDELYVILRDSAGNNIIDENGYENYKLLLTSPGSSQQIVPVDVSDDGVTFEKAWQFNVDKMESGFTYAFCYEDTLCDQITVQWEFETTTCNKKEFARRKIEQVTYNDSIFYEDGVHVVVRY